MGCWGIVYSVIREVAVSVIPALRVVVVERAGRIWHYAEQQAGRVTHHPPGVHLLCPLRADSFQPGHLGRQVIGVWMSTCTRPGPSLRRCTSRQNSWPRSVSPWYSGMRAELGQRLADGRLPGFAGAEPPSPCKGGAGSAGPEVNRSSDRVSAAGA